jgi:hypothetical protein
MTARRSKSRGVKLGQALKVVFPLALVGLIASGASSCDTSSGGSSKGSGATQVQFSVTGSAPAGVDITYGNDSSNYQGPKHPPMNKTLSVKKDALYYDVTAQLQGGGSITCKLKIGDAVKVGHAKGGYNICSAQLNSDPINGGWG